VAGGIPTFVAKNNGNKRFDFQGISKEMFEINALKL